MAKIKQVEIRRSDICDQPLRWCRLPYPKHPQGCPNIGNPRPLKGLRPEVRPRVMRECPSGRDDLTLDQIFDLDKPVYVLDNIFPVGKEAQRLRTTSPVLTTVPQIYNVRYWQNKARAELYAIVTDFLSEQPNMIVDLCPEAHGAKMIPIVDRAGTRLHFDRWPPAEHYENLVKHQIAFAGYPKDLEMLIETGRLGRKR